MKRTITIITIATMVVTIAGFSAFAANRALQNRQSQGQKNQPMAPGGQMNQRMGPQGGMPADQPDGINPGFNLRRLDLSNEQQGKIKDLTKDYREKTADIRDDLRDAQKDLRAALKEDTVDQAQVDKLLEQIATLKSQLDDATTQQLLAIKSVLTPEQLEKLADAKAEREANQPLSDELRDKIAEINKAAQETIQTLRDELRDLRSQFQDLLIAKETDQAQLKAIQDQLSAKEAALEKAQVDRVLQIKAVLTPEQFKLFERMETQRNQPNGPMQNFQGQGQMMPPQQGFQGRQFQGPQGFDGQPQQQPPQGQFPGRRGQF